VERAAAALLSSGEVRLKWTWQTRPLSFFKPLKFLVRMGGGEVVGSPKIYLADYYSSVIIRGTYEKNVSFL
jgi:hypothetical protein